MANDQEWEARIQRTVKSIPRTRYPVIIELSGMPKLGKTLFSDSLVDLLRKSGCAVRLSSNATVESAIADKWSLEFSAWTLCAFITEYLELRQTSTQIIVADRGLFDAIVWLRLKLQDGRCDEETLHSLRAVARTKPWIDSVCLVLAYISPPERVLARARERRLYEGDSLVTTEQNLVRLGEAIEAEAALWNADRGVVRLLERRRGSIREEIVEAAEEVVASLERYCSLTATRM